MEDPAAKLLERVLRARAAVEALAWLGGRVGRKELRRGVGSRARRASFALAAERRFAPVLHADRNCSSSLIGLIGP